MSIYIFILIFVNIQRKFYNYDIKLLAETSKKTVYHHHFKFHPFKYVVNNTYFTCYSFREHLPVPDQKVLAINLYYEWFEPAVDRWLDVAKFKVCL